MSRRAFIFCDICNPQAIRCLELRRNCPRGRDSGRRASDGRAWFEGEDDEARQAGWLLLDGGRHVCPDCLKQLKSLQPLLEKHLGLSLVEDA